MPAPRDEAPLPAVTVTAVRSRVVSTVPAWSVLRTVWLWARIRAIVPAFGWPYLLFAPTETTATDG